MIDDWYAVEAIDPQTFAINEPKSSQYNTSYLIIGNTRALMFDAGSGERPAVTFSGAKQPTPAELQHLHDEAHAECFIANSVQTKVCCEPRLNVL